MNAGMKDILNTMSKFVNMGMPLQAVIKSNTSRAAEVIKRPDLGNLSVGSEADVAVLNLRRGAFGFVDSGGGKLQGDRKLECELTVKAGQVVWDLNGHLAAVVERAAVGASNAGTPISASVLDRRSAAPRVQQSTTVSLPHSVQEAGCCE